MSIQYHFATSGTDSFRSNNLFSQYIEEDVETPEGEGAITEKVRKFPNVFVSFVSADGKHAKNAKLSRSFEAVHPQAFARYQSYCTADATGRFQPGSLMWAEGKPVIRRNDEGVAEVVNRRMILFAGTKRFADDQHDLGLLEICLQKIVEWVDEVIKKDPKGVILALAIPRSDGSPWSDVQPLYEQYLGTLPCPVIVTLSGKLAPVAPRAVREVDSGFVGEGEKVDTRTGEVLAGAGDPYLPDYEDSLENDPIYIEAEVVDAEEAEEDSNVAQALAKARAIDPELAEAFMARDAAIKYATR